MKRNARHAGLIFLSVPHAVFTDPEAAGVGMTEERYMAAYGTCNCRTVPLDRVPRAVAVRDTRGLVKMGLAVDDLIDTVHAFPTYSEAIKMAAQAFRRDISNMSCCVE